MPLDARVELSLKTEKVLVNRVLLPKSRRLFQSGFVDGLGLEILALVQPVFCNLLYGGDEGWAGGWPCGARQIPSLLDERVRLLHVSLVTSFKGGCQHGFET